MSLQKVARATNLSVSTISRVLNGKAHVAEETRQKVLAISGDLGVFPKRRGRRAVRDFTNGHSATHAPVTILMDMDISSTFLSELTVSVQRLLAEYGFQCVLQTFSGEYTDFVRALGYIQPPNAAACIAVGYFTDKEVLGVLGANPKCVFLDYMPSPDLGLPLNVVTHDNVAAVRLSVRQLVASDCKRIVCLQGLPYHHFSRAMREGFLSVLEQDRFTEGQLLTCDLTAGGGYRAIKAAIDAGNDFDGLFTTDEMAFGAIRAIKEAGKRIPDDVKVMGCDGIELGKQLHPPLSTVVLDREELGRRAVKRLMEIIDVDAPTFEQILIPPRLELRGTCAPKAAMERVEAQVNGKEGQ